MLIDGSDRNQLQFFALEEIIGEDNPVRVIDALVDALDFKALGFILTGTATTGREAYGPGVLLKLYLYGYLNRIRSSRRLEAECARNVELWWLLRQLRPKYRSIAEFRAANRKPLLQTFRAFNRFLNGHDLFGKTTIAVDGSKFRAQNSKKNNFNLEKIKRQKQYILQKSEEYLQQLEKIDCDEEREQMEAKIEKQHNRLEKYNDLEKRLEQSNDRQISTSDPDARALPKHMGIVEVGYNVQSAVDDKHHLVVHFEVTNEKDDHALAQPAKKAKKEMGLGNEDSLNVLADKGYHTGSQIQQCHDENIQTFVAEKKRSDNKAGGFKKQDFIYLKETDEYICPEGHHLQTNGNWYTKNRGKGRTEYRVKVYKLPFHVCNACPHRVKCSGQANLNNSKGRPIERSEYDQDLDINGERLRANPEIYKRRQQIVEHPFGTIKRQWGYDYTLLKTKEKVRADFALIFTAYNLRRTMSILGVKELIKRIKGHFWALFPHLSAFFIVTPLTVVATAIPFWISSPTTESPGFR